MLVQLVKFELLKKINTKFRMLKVQAKLFKWSVYGGEFVMCSIQMSNKSNFVPNYVNISYVFTMIPVGIT